MGLDIPPRGPLRRLVSFAVWANKHAGSQGERRERLVLNGEDRSFESVRDIAALVAVLGFDRRKIAVERNLAIVPRSAYGATPLVDGDRIEIVHFIGGG